MNICGISSWKPRQCGIATYYEEQSSAIAKRGHTFSIVCHPDGGRHQDQPNIHGILDQSSPEWPDTVFRYVVEHIQPDVVHIQHEFGLYNTQTGPNSWDNAPRLLALLGLFRMAGVPTVVTCHTLCGHMKPDEVEHYKLMIPLSTITVAHASYQVSALERNIGLIPPNVTYVEHGANEHAPLEIARLRAEGRREFGLEGQTVVGMNGWWNATKNFHHIIERWGDIHRRVGRDDVALALMGAACEVDPAQVFYKQRLLEAVAASPARDSIVVVERAFTPHMFELALGSFDLAVLPYAAASQSGVAAHTGAMGTAMLLRDLEGLGAYARSAHQELIPLTENTESDMDIAADRIVDILCHPQLLEEMKRDVLHYTHDILAWGRVAERYEMIFQRAVEMAQSGEEAAA